VSVVAPEVAADEFDRMCDAIDLDLSDLTEEETKTLDALKKLVVKAITSGRITVDEKGQPTIALKYPVGEFKDVTLFRPNGEMLLAAGDPKLKNEVERTFALLADFTKKPVALFRKMEARPDLQLCKAVLQLFLP
jgi:hypothetical protein